MYLILINKNKGNGLSFLICYNILIINYIIHTFHQQELDFRLGPLPGWDDVQRDCCVMQDLLGYASHYDILQPFLAV